MLTAAKTGVSACRAFHQAASEPCGSVSIKATGPDPAASASTPRCPDRVVLPTPPFWAQKARTCIMRNYVSTYVRKYVHAYNSPAVIGWRGGNVVACSYREIGQYKLDNNRYFMCNFRKPRNLQCVLRK